MRLLDTIAAKLGYVRANTEPEIVFEVVIDTDDKQYAGEMITTNLNALMQQWKADDPETPSRMFIWMDMQGTNTYISLELGKVKTILAVPKVAKNEPSQPAS